MQRKQHPLVSPATGTQRHVVSWHYGQPDSTGPHVYLQASLHADELPGMLVLQHLKTQLDAAEAAGRLTGRVTVVPVANPIGLDQTPVIAPQLSHDPAQNTRVIREAIHAWLRAQPPRTELETLRHTLLDLAIDADVVLDLHCDFEAVLHLYVEAPYLAQAEPLIRHLGAETVLWANDDLNCAPHSPITRLSSPACQVPSSYAANKMSATRWHRRMPPTSWPIWCTRVSSLVTPAPYRPLDASRPHWLALKP